MNVFDFRYVGVVFDLLMRYSQLVPSEEEVMLTG